MDRRAQHLLETAAEAAPRSSVEAAARLLEVGRQPVRAAFVARALNALARLATELDEQALGDAAGAPSDMSTLLRALEQPAAQTILTADDPLAPARLRGLQARDQLLRAEGGTLGVNNVATLLNISRQAVDKRRKAGTLLGVPTGRHGYAYPAWQFAEHGTLAGMSDVLVTLRSFDPWMQLAFFLNGNTRLAGQSPLEALRQGRIGDVLQAARTYGEHGAD